MAGRDAKTRASKRAAKPSGRAETVARPEEPAGLPGESLVEEYLDSLRFERASSRHTIRSYETDLMAFLRWCKRHGVNPQSATHRQLRSYLGELDAARYERSTVNRHLSSIRGFYTWMSERGVIDDDPASALSGPKRGKHLPHVLRHDEMDRLLAVHGPVDEAGAPRDQSLADKRDQAILELLYACGARISEVASLQVSDVDFTSRLVKLFGKGSKERIVPLHNLCAETLQVYLRDVRPQLLGGKRGSALFVSTRGNPMSADAIRRMFKATVRAAGLDETLSPHDMRHTFATDLLDGEANLRSVQEMLGHASLSTTQIYTHLSAARLKEAHSQAHPRA